jgi:hypothetical protein
VLRAYTEKIGLPCLYFIKSVIPQRQGSAAAESRSGAGAEAVGSQLQPNVRP